MSISESLMARMIDFLAKLEEAGLPEEKIDEYHDLMGALAERE